MSGIEGKTGGTPGVFFNNTGVERSQTLTGNPSVPASPLPPSQRRDTLTPSSPSKQISTEKTASAKSMPSGQEVRRGLVHLSNKNHSRDLGQNDLLHSNIFRRLAPEVQLRLVKSRQRSIAYQEQLSKQGERHLPRKARNRLLDRYRTNLATQQQAKPSAGERIQKQARKVRNFVENRKKRKQKRQIKKALQEKIKGHKGEIINTKEQMRQIKRKAIKKALQEKIESHKREIKNTRQQIKNMK